MTRKLTLNDEVVKNFTLARAFAINGKDYKASPDFKDLTFEEETTTTESMDFHLSEPLLVAATTSNRICLYNTRDGRCEKIVASQKYGATSICFTHHPSCVVYASNKDQKGEMSSASGAGDKNEQHAIRYHSLFDNSYIRYFAGHTDKVLNVTTSKISDRFVTSSMDKTVKYWDLRNENAVATEKVECDYPTVAIDSTETVIAIGSEGGAVQLKAFSAMGQDGPFWNKKIDLIAVEERAYHSQMGQNGKEKRCKLSSLKFSADNNSLLAVLENRIYLVDIQPKKEESIKWKKWDLGEPQDSVRLEASFSPDNKYVITGCVDKSVRIFNAETGSEVCRLEQEHVGIPSCVAWSPKQALFASACKGMAFWIPKEESIQKHQHKEVITLSD